MWYRSPKTARRTKRASRPGDGQNLALIAGEINGSLTLSAGAGDDVVELADTAVVGRSVTLALGDGDNTMELAGAVLGNLKLTGGEGDDLVTIAPGAMVAGNVSLRLGTGDNSVEHAGDIGGDLRVSSLNANDVVNIDPDATVGGVTDLNLGLTGARGPRQWTRPCLAEELAGTVDCDHELHLPSKNDNREARANRASR